MLDMQDSNLLKKVEKKRKLIMSINILVMRDVLWELVCPAGSEGGIDAI
jgi:hypothetical protein